MWAAPTLGPHPWSRSGDRDVKSALCWASVRDDSCRRYLLDACAVLPGCLVGKIRLSVPPIPVRPPAFPSKTLSLSLLPGVCPDPKLWAKLSLELNKAPISSRADRAIVPAFIVSLRVCSRCSEVSKMEAAGRESWTIRWDRVSTDKRDERKAHRHGHRRTPDRQITGRQSPAPRAAAGDAGFPLLGVASPCGWGNEGRHWVNGARGEKLRHPAPPTCRGAAQGPHQARGSHLRLSSMHRA